MQHAFAGSDSPKTRRGARDVAMAHPRCPAGLAGCGTPCSIKLREVKDVSFQSLGFQGITSRAHNLDLNGQWLLTSFWWLCCNNMIPPTMCRSSLRSKHSQPQCKFGEHLVSDKSFRHLHRPNGHKLEHEQRDISDRFSQCFSLCKARLEHNHLPTFWSLYSDPSNKTRRAHVHAFEVLLLLRRASDSSGRASPKRRATKSSKAFLCRILILGCRK